MEVSNNIATKQQATQAQATQQTAKVEQETLIKAAELDNSSTKNIETEKDARDLVKKLNKALDPFNTSIRFGFDNADDVFFVSVVDTSTSDTIRRFPAEKANTLVGKMNEIVGIIFDEKG